MATPKGGYFNAAGEKVPGTTTVLGRFKDSGGLLFWAHKVGGEQQGVIWRNRICRWAGPLITMDADVPWNKLISAEKLDALRNGAWQPEPEFTRLYDVSEAAAAAGTLAHDAIEAFIKAKGADFSHEWPTDVDPDVLAKAMNAYGQFLRWFGQTKIRIIETEFGSMSEKHGFGGTLDGLGLDEQDRYVLLDWKTSNAIYPDYLLQLAAYALLLEENRGIKVEEFHIVRVAKENADFAHASFQDLEHEKTTFLRMLQLYKDVKQIERRVR